MKPSRTRRPRQVGHLFPVLEAALFTQKLASEAKSNLELDGMVSVDHTSEVFSFSFLARLDSRELALGQSNGSTQSSVHSAG